MRREDSRQVDTSLKRILIIYGTFSTSQSKLVLVIDLFLLFARIRYPDALQNATHSTSYLGQLVASRYPSTTREWVQTEVYEKGLGIMDVASWELDQLWQESTDAYKANGVLADAVRTFFSLILFMEGRKRN